MQQREPGRPLGYGALIRAYPNFRRLWCGQIVSLLGDWFNLIASASLVASLTGSGFAIGSLFIVRALAPFLISPVAGVVADRFNRKWILICADLARGLVVLGFLLVRDPAHVWLLYVLTALQLGISGFFFPARNAILPDIVPQQAVGAANALGAATWSVMLAFGAAIGGLVSGMFGVYTAFLVDSASFFVSALFISRIRLDVRPEAHAHDRTLRGAFRQYVDGWRYLYGHRDVLVTVLLKGSMTLFMGASFEVVQVAITHQIFVIGVGGGIGLGLMYATGGLGTGLGPICARRFTGDRLRALRWAIVLGFVLAASGLTVISSLVNFPVVLLGTLIRSSGGGLVWVFSTQLLLHMVPGHIRGRVFSIEFAFFALMAAVGATLSGTVLDLAPGLAWMLRGMAGLVLIPGAGWLAWLLWRERT